MMIRNIFILLLIAFSVNAQNVFDGLKNQEKIGDDLAAEFSYVQALNHYLIAVRKSNDEKRIQLKIADTYRKLNDPENAVKWYKDALSNGETPSDISLLHYAQMLMSVKSYDEAGIWYKKYVQAQPSDTRSERKIGALNNMPFFLKDSARVTVEKLNINSSYMDFSPAIYKNGLVFVSSRPANGSRKMDFNWDGSNYLELFYTKNQEDGAFSSPEIFHKKLNSKYHEGPVTFYNNDNNIIFTRNNYLQGQLGRDGNGIVKLKLLTASKSDEGIWSDPTPLSFDNDNYSFGHPTVSSDGKKLYFAADMEGTIGATDIYFSEWQDGQWGKPKNLGPSINTEGNEMFPYIYNDSLLYFSSDGLGGLGGLDIYEYNLKSQHIRNLGYPINTHADDFGLVLLAGGVDGYFTSNRAGGAGKDDIYRLIFKRNLINFHVVDKSNNRPLKSVDIQVVKGDSSINISTNSEGEVTIPLLPGAYDLYVNTPNYLELIQQTTIALGQNETVKLALSPIDKDIPEVIVEDVELLSVAAKSKENMSDEVISTPKKKVDNTIESGGLINQKEIIQLYNITNLSGETQSFITADDDFYVFQKKGESYAYIDQDGQVIFEMPHELPNLKNERDEIIVEVVKDSDYIVQIIDVYNIYYDLNSAIIRNDASVQLDKLVVVLNMFPHIHVELHSHTDSRGSQSYNEKLAAKRVASAKAYLVNEGIDEKRITTGSFGEGTLVNDCGDDVTCSEDKHQLNRRTEFKLIFK